MHGNCFYLGEPVFLSSYSEVLQIEIIEESKTSVSDAKI